VVFALLLLIGARLGDRSGLPFACLGFLTWYQVSRRFHLWALLPPFRAFTEALWFLLCVDSFMFLVCWFVFVSFDRLLLGQL